MSDGDTYEKARSLEQDLAFRAAEAAFERYSAALSASKYRALDIAQNDRNTPALAEKTLAAITPQMKTVMDCLAERGKMKDEDLQKLLNVEKTRVYLLARQMHENGLINIVGRGTDKKYKLK